MRTMHLFAGAGGGLLADLILGHTPVVAVEWDAYCCQVLRERAADGWFPGLHVHEGDVRLFDPSEYAGRVDCIAAGFPCQDISSAGKGGGINGARSGLYREVMRAIDAVRPRFVFLENSPQIRTRGRHVVIADLVARGYAWRDGILAASDVGAPHQRDRWWCLAQRSDTPDERRGEARQLRHDEPAQRAACVREEVPDANGNSIQRIIVGSPDAQGRQEPCNGSTGSRDHGIGWWTVEPRVCRVVDGLPARAHRIRALGNAQVPLQAAAAWKLLGGP